MQMCSKDLKGFSFVVVLVQLSFIFSGSIATFTVCLVTTVSEMSVLLLVGVAYVFAYHPL